MSKQNIENLVNGLAPLDGANVITTFIHCRLCLEEWKDGAAGDVSPREYASLEVGWTGCGIQVWCKRHECQVAHIELGSRNGSGGERQDDD